MKFDRIPILQFSGMFTKLIQSGGYRESKYLKIRSYLIFFLSVSAVFRMPISQLYDHYDHRQLFVGNFFNHLNIFSRKFLSIGTGFVVISWLSSLFIYFRYLNKKESVVLFWLKLTSNISIRDDQFKVVGISQKQNKSFWNRQNNFNGIFQRVIYVYVAFACIIFTAPLIFMSNIYLEIAKINFLFNKFIGFNYFHVFGFELSCVFAALFGDTILKIGLSVVCVAWFFLPILCPFYLAETLKNKIHKVNFILQNLSFKQMTNLRNRKKINHVSTILKYNDGYIFFCFNLFPLTLQNAFNSAFQISVNVLLLIKVTDVLNNL